MARATMVVANLNPKVAKVTSSWRVRQVSDDIVDRARSMQRQQLKLPQVRQAKLPPGSLHGLQDQEEPLENAPENTLILTILTKEAMATEDMGFEVDSELKALPDEGVPRREHELPIEDQPLAELSEGLTPHGFLVKESSSPTTGHQ